MNTYRRIWVLCAALIVPVGAMAISFSDILSGLSGPKIEITVDHPPSLPLKVTAVAIAKPEGQCGDEVGSRVEEDFVQSGVTVIDRQRLQDVLSEYKLQTNLMIDRKTAAKVGNLLGAQALVFLKVLECHTENSQREVYTDKKTHRTVYNYVTTAAISGSLRVVDLTTGRVLAAQHFEGNGGLQNSDRYPGRDAALGEAETAVTLSIHKLLLPWKETKSLVFYDDKECGLTKATRLLRAKDLDGALKQSESNLSACKDKPDVKPAIVARAYYNLGMLQFMQRDYDTALANLSEADKLQSSKVFLDAITACRQAKQYAVTVAQTAPDQPGTQASANTSGTFKPVGQSTSVPKTTAAQPIEDRLRQLEDLLKKKLITQEEYNQRRSKILDGI